MKSNNSIKEIKVPLGIWTPNAKVLCYECHGNKFPHCTYNSETGKLDDIELNKEEFKDMNSDKTIKAGYAITKCNRRNKDIQLIEGVANENTLVDTLKESGINAYMSQTGGMNSAAEIPTKDNGFIWITYDTCGEGLYCT